MSKKWMALTLVSTRCFGADVDASQLVELPLEHLMKMNIEVTSSAKREQRSFDTAAAVFVITADDIRRSGVVTIPDALRMAPGVQVEQINNNEWAVGVRGLGGRFSRYLLVLVDGRSLYDNLFSGVNWDELNLTLEDIDRVEVIRGPGSTVWGANAVNGVVNIVTKVASAKDGQQVAVGGGNYYQGLASGQTSHSLGENTAYRLSANYFRRDGLESLHQGLEEGDAYGERISFAMNHHRNGDEWLLNADVFQLHNDTYWVETTPSGIVSTGGAGGFEADEDKLGYAIQGRYSHQIDDLQTLKVRLSADDVERDSAVFLWNNRNIDIDIEYIAMLGDHYLTLGANNRFNTNEVRQTSRSQFLLEPEKDDSSTNSLFVHDTLSLAERWKVDMGLRYEKHSEVGENVQGTLRALWLVNDQQRLWAAISKADNTPSRITYSISESVFATIPVIPPALPFPVQIALVSSDGAAENAELIASELGYRQIFSDRLSMDVTAFYNEYSNIITIGQSADFISSVIDGNPYWRLELGLTGNAEVRSNGVELMVNWQLYNQWFLQYSGSYINFKDEGLVGGGDFAAVFSSFNIVSDVPAHQHSLRLLGDLNDQWSLSFWLRYVGELAQVQIDSYTVLDAQVSYKPRRDVTISLVAQNFGAGDHAQATREAYYVDTFEVEPSLHAKVSWSF